MPGMVCEGGTFRTIFTFGVQDALLENNIVFPYVIGVSAGAAYSCSYVCRQKERNITILLKYRNDPRYCGLRNILKEKSLFGLDFAYHQMVTKLIPLHFDTYKNNTNILEAGVTNCLTGRAEYIPFDPDDEYCRVLMASTAVPLLFPPIEVHGVPYFDGGITDSIPLQHAIDKGYKKNLVILTQPKGFVKENNKFIRFAARRLQKKFPEVTNAIYRRPDMYNAELAFCHEQEKQGNAVILQPDFPLHDMEKNPEVIKQVYEQGYKKAVSAMDAITALFK